MSIRSFITGSMLYGKPKKNSDIDLVILIDPYGLEMLKKQADAVYNDSTGSAGGPQSASMMFGKLNLLATTDEDAFAVWKLGTTRCWHLNLKRGRKPLTRKEACNIFSKMRKIYLPYEETEE